MANVTAGELLRRTGNSLASYLPRQSQTLRQRNKLLWSSSLWAKENGGSYFQIIWVKQNSSLWGKISSPKKLCDSITKTIWVFNRSTIKSMVKVFSISGDAKQLELPATCPLPVKIQGKSLRYKIIKCVLKKNMLLQPKEAILSHG